MRSNYRVVVFELRRLEVRVFANDREEARKIWKNGESIASQIIDTELIDVSRIT